MVKLTHSVNKDDNKPKPQGGLAGGSLSIKKTTQNTQTETTQNAEQISVSEVATFEVEVEQSHKGLANWLIQTFGEATFMQLKANPHLNLPFVDNDTEMQLTDWLEKSLKLILNEELLQTAIAALKQKEGKWSELQKQVSDAIAELSAAKQKQEEAHQKYLDLKEEVDEQEDEKFRLKKQLNASLDLKILINENFKEEAKHNNDIKHVYELLREETEMTTSETSSFVLKLCKGWAGLMVVKKISQDENEESRMDSMHKALSALLEQLSGQSNPSRRSILDAIASYVSDEFKNYEFVSPEQTLQIDPAIHDAQGIGNGTIREGLSFAVLRKDSRQAVRYANITI